MFKFIPHTLIVISILINIGCEKESISTNLVPIPVLENSFVTMKTADSSYTFSDEILVNSYYFGSQQDQLSLALTDSLGHMVAIHLLGANIRNRIYPSAISNTFGDGESGEIQLRNLNIPMDTVYGENDSVNYIGHTNDELKIRLLSYQDSIIEGTFEGPINTRSGKQMIIQEGYFNVPVVEQLK